MQTLLSVISVCHAPNSSKLGALFRELKSDGDNAEWHLSVTSAQRTKKRQNAFAARLCVWSHVISTSFDTGQDFTSSVFSITLLHHAVVRPQDLRDLSARSSARPSAKDVGQGKSGVAQMCGVLAPSLKYLSQITHFYFHLTTPKYLRSCFKPITQTFLPLNLHCSLVIHQLMAFRWRDQLLILVCGIV